MKRRGETVVAKTPKKNILGIIHVNFMFLQEIIPVYTYINFNS
jgi:hypothetical protein